ncbi:hypothetical protein BKA70DRAFT_1427152 [Coprinopsis sp. MPI-PUGE-AT-0042]|nr:hypothetical protein BKA70DRAFT_1427152 [Coprinopsis sp. MPI-PUGE-AT-0042]
MSRWQGLTRHRGMAALVLTLGFSIRTAERSRTPAINSEMKIVKLLTGVTKIAKVEPWRLPSKTKVPPALSAPIMDGEMLGRSPGEGWEVKLARVVEESPIYRRSRTPYHSRNPQVQTNALLIAGYSSTQIQWQLRNKNLQSHDTSLLCLSLQPQAVLSQTQRPLPQHLQRQRNTNCSFPSCLILLPIPSHPITRRSVSMQTYRISTPPTPIVPSSSLFPFSVSPASP